MAHHPMSRPDPFDPPQPVPARISLGPNEKGEIEQGLSLAELATALSAHGGGALSADLALDLVLNEIVEHARLATGATAAAIALARRDEIVCRATTGANAPDLGVKLDAHSGLSGACVQSMKWQRCDDTETDARVDAAVCRDLGVRSILVFPVTKGDKLLGVFEIFSPRPSAFSDREIQTLQALSRSIVNNVDRAADVVAPATPALPSLSMQAAAAATMAEVERLDHLQLDSVQMKDDPPDPALLDLKQIDPPEVDLPPLDLTPIDLKSPDLTPLDLTPPEIPPVLESLPAITTESPAQPRDRWMGVLTLTVIALALFLGWMMGYVRSHRGPAKAKATTNAASVPAPPKPTEAAPGGTAVVRVPDQPIAGRSALAPASSQPSSPSPNESHPSDSGTLPPGGLVVYENGKVIYRTPPQTPPSYAKDAGGPVKVPSKVADEYLMLRVEPEYPESARAEHIQGPVVLEALVGKDGAVEKLRTVSGDGQLAAAATNAVQQWRFKPFFRNGSPEEFRTQITVSFRLP